MTAFYVKDFDTFYMVGFEHEKFNGLKYGGSFNLVAARLLGLSYTDYLRFARDVYKAELRGKQGYSRCTFAIKNDCKRFVDFLNREWELLEEFLNNGI